MATLKPFRDMKTEIGTQLSNLLRFIWKIYKRKKEKKKKKKKGKKGKGKKGSKKLDASKTMQLTPGKSFNATGSSAAPSKGGNTGKAAAGSATKPGAKDTKLKVTA